MKVAILLVALIALVYSVSTEQKDAQQSKHAFNHWARKHQKKYATDDEYTKRFSIFQDNLKFVQSHDAKAKGFSVALNKFADMTGPEFKAFFNGLNLQVETPVVAQPADISGLPATVDWRTKGAVTKVKNQEQCGSCWSFSTTGSVEGAHFLKTNKLVSLSEQNLVDCSVPEGNQGCNGGLMDQAFQYIISNKGIDTEASYPYTATGPNQCKYDPKNDAATISSFTDIPSGDENALQAAVATTPVSVAIDASQSSFQFYSSGVYYEPACSSTQLDHGVLAIGYGSDSGSDYWLVKNSWGTDWGMAGFINMSRNRNNNCGIATAASFPIV